MKQTQTELILISNIKETSTLTILALNKHQALGNREGKQGLRDIQSLANVTPRTPEYSLGDTPASLRKSIGQPIVS